MAEENSIGSLGMKESDVLTAIFKNLAVGVIVCDTHARFLFFSPEAERILGTGAIQADFAAWSAAYGCFRPDRVTPYPPDELPLARAVRGEEALHELIFIRNAARPEGLWIDASATPLRGVSDEVCGGVVVFSDISVPENLLSNDGAVTAFLAPVADYCDAAEDRNGQVSARFARFRTMIAQLARAVDQTADSILITNTRGIIEYVNPAFETVTGFSAAEVLGRKPSLLKSGKHNSDFYRDLWGRLTAGESFQGTIINRKKSGDLFWSEQTISPIKNQAGVTTHFVSVLKDMTALRKQLERDFQLGLAREIQQRLYGATASLPGFDIAAGAYPADETGGDYFDFIPQPDGSLYIVIADISGHGFGSALVMAEVRASLRAYAAMVPEIAQIFSLVNRSLAATLEGNGFVTMFLGRLNPHQRTLEYASAGHEPGYLLRRSGEIGTTLASSAPPLGLFPDHQFPSSHTVALEHGDTILLLTDGITESAASDSSFFGAEGALTFVRGQPLSTSHELVYGLYQAARAFAGNALQRDDILSVICRVE